MDYTHPLTVALNVIGIGCDVLPGGVPGITAISIYDQMTKMEKEGVNGNRVRCVGLVKYFKTLINPKH